MLVSVHAVLLSEDLLHHQLWLDADVTAAPRVVSKGTRSLVDAAVQVVAIPRSGASAIDLASTLLRWPGVRDLTLLNMAGATDLSPLSTASLAGLTSLTVRQRVPRLGTWDMPAPSSSVAATLRVIDTSACESLLSIDFIRSCVQLRRLWMPSCFSVTDLSPLRACSETLEELWMARADGTASLAPLAACSGLRKLDIRGCSPSLTNQVEGLQRGVHPAGRPTVGYVRGPGAPATAPHAPQYSFVRSKCALAPGPKCSDPGRDRCCRRHSASGAAVIGRGAAGARVLPQVYSRGARASNSGLALRPEPDRGRCCRRHSASCETSGA